MIIEIFYIPIGDAERHSVELIINFRFEIGRERNIASEKLHNSIYAVSRYLASTFQIKHVGVSQRFPLAKSACISTRTHIFKTNIVLEAGRNGGRVRHQFGVSWIVFVLSLGKY